MIRKLPPHLIQQIAAGEVIERPASALKELIENSLDAEASRIKIRSLGGGNRLYEVEDDGLGIAVEDLPMAFEPHATSKLSRMEDFDSLQSFGFRGEALAALSSVADVTLETSTANDSVGHRLRSSFGQLSPVEIVDKRQGTKIRVEDIFARLPVRNKFLKSDRSETSAALQVFRKYALSSPLVDFEFEDLESNRRIRAPGRSIFERALWFFDSQVPESWMELRSERAGWKVSIVALQPKFLHQAKAGIHLYLNHRPIKDQKLEFAVRKGFEGYADQPRLISAVVFVEGPADSFDVNVHPTKQEIRWLQADSLFSLIVQTLQAHLGAVHRSSWIEPIAAPSTSFVEEVIPAASQNKQASFDTVPVRIAEQRVLFENQETFEYLGQLDRTYLLVKRGSDLLLFDQHALHERILYEELLSLWNREQRLPQQRLLFPLSVSVPAEDLSLQNEEIFEKLGFEFRIWNDGRAQIVSTPAILKRGAVEAFLALCQNKDRPMETILRDALSTIACHAAVRAHDVLDAPQAKDMLMKFHSDDALGHCPHGRPTFIKWKTTELEKLFHRVV